METRRQSKDGAWHFRRIPRVVLTCYPNMQLSVWHQKKTDHGEEVRETHDMSTELPSFLLSSLKNARQDNTDKTGKAAWRGLVSTSIIPGGVADPYYACSVLAARLVGNLRSDLIWPLPPPPYLRIAVLTTRKYVQFKSATFSFACLGPYTYRAIVDH